MNLRFGESSDICELRCNYLKYLVQGILPKIVFLKATSQTARMGLKQTNAWFLNYFYRFFTKNKFFKKATTFFIWRDFKGVQFQPAIENQTKSFQGLAEFPCLVKNWIKIHL